MNVAPTIEAIREKFEELVADLDVHPHEKTFRTTPAGDGSPHVEKEGDIFYFVRSERGHEFERIGTTDPVEVLYLLLSDVTWNAASTYELRHRVEGIDGRELSFPYEERLLGEMNPEWALRKRREHELILEKSPFRAYEVPLPSPDTSPPPVGLPRRALGFLRGILGLGDVPRARG